MVSEDQNKHDYSRFKPAGYPVRHRRKVPFNPQISLDIGYRRTVARIRELDRELGSFMLSGEAYLDMVNEAYSENIHWSTKIEGNRLSLEQVRHLTKRFTAGESMESRHGPEQEIINHLYSFFDSRLFEYPWTVETVLGVHALLMEGVNEDVVAGSIRTEEVAVVGSDGTEFFIACPPGSIPEELESLLEWLRYSPYDEIATSAIFFHGYESIHPFKDGNGRTGRTLFQVLLQELGLRNCKLCRFEKEMLSDTETYYDLLAYTDSTGVYTQLVYYMADALLRAYEEAVVAFREKDILKGLDDNSKALCQFAKKRRTFTLKDATAELSFIGGEQSVRARINRLCGLGLIESIGRTRGQRYRFNDPLEKLHVEKE